jgi:hypothetical protein
VKQIIALVNFFLNVAPLVKRSERKSNNGLFSAADSSKQYLEVKGLKKEFFKSNNDIVK